MQAQSGRRAQIDAEKKAEKARVQSVIRQMGAQQQAESTALAGLRSTASGKSNKTSSGVSTEQTPGGFLGSNLTTTAGTFGQG